MRRVAPGGEVPWLCVGDFNEFLWGWEKCGGNRNQTTQMTDFRATIMDLNIQDLGFSGNRYTWSNGRTGDDNIQVRHLLRTHSDHNPLLIEANQLPATGTAYIRLKKPFRFEKLWLDHEDCNSIINMGWDPRNHNASFSDRTRSCAEQLKS
ncbi:hypothetical protein ACS0TY_020596 [Phlomoides rotata]